MTAETCTNRGGYLYVRATDAQGVPKTVRVAQAVAWAFIGPQGTGIQVRHLNGDRTDNRVLNLAYGTRSQNTLDSVGHGTHNMASKSACPQGHEFTAENTYVRPTGGRRCRRCQRIWRRAADARLRAARRRASEVSFS